MKDDSVRVKLQVYENQGDKEIFLCLDPTKTNLVACWYYFGREGYAVGEAFLTVFQGICSWHGKLIEVVPDFIRVLLTARIRKV